MLPDIDLGALGGLNDQEAAERLRVERANELPSTKRRGLLALAWEVIREPMLLLLVGAGAIYLVLGELKDSLVLLASITVDLFIENVNPSMAKESEGSQAQYCRGWHQFR